MLFVRPSHQRSGIGRGLLEAAITLAGDPDCGLTVNSSPNAVSAYQHMGFQVTDSEQCVHGIRFVPMHRATEPSAAANVR
jgi:GNAT superfamily N-acetyltransferase